MRLSDAPIIADHLKTYPEDRDVAEILPWLDRYRRIDPSRIRVLSVGCNDDPLAEMFARFGVDTVGVDLRQFNETSYPIAADYPMYQHRVLDWLGEWPELPAGIEAGAFDVALAVSSVEHFGLAEFGGAQCSDGDARAMQLIRKALRVGGQCILVVPFGCEHYECPNWRRYTRETIKPLLEGFALFDRRYFWTAAKGLARTDDPALAVDYYNESADLSAAFLLSKEA